MRICRVYRLLNLSASKNSDENSENYFYNHERHCFTKIFQKLSSTAKIQQISNNLSRKSPLIFISFLTNYVGSNVRNVKNVTKYNFCKISDSLKFLNNLSQFFVANFRVVSLIVIADICQPTSRPKTIDS